jgi:hypothetical protein
MGDKEFKLIEPSLSANNYLKKQEVWTMARGAFHIISVDILCLNILLLIINFTNLIPNERFILKLISIYLFIWAVAFMLIVLVSKNFQNKLIKLPQWILFSLLSGLLYWASL